LCSGKEKIGEDRSKDWPSDGSSREKKRLTGGGEGGGGNPAPPLTRVGGDKIFYSIKGVTLTKVTQAKREKGDSEQPKFRKLDTLRYAEGKNGAHSDPRGGISKKSNKGYPLFSAVGTFTAGWAREAFVSS